jgi:nicotinate-nucleotide adenylyltransferase
MRALLRAPTRAPLRPRIASRFGTVAAHPPLVGARQRIGLLGGTFDPPHAAHVLISEIALKRLQLDRVWWLITPGNPLKTGTPLPSVWDRLALCRALTSDPRITATAFEAHLSTAYTAATLDFLRMRFPEVEFVWIMGADCLAQFHRWYDWLHIFQTLPVAVVDRPGWRLKASAGQAAQTFGAYRLPEIAAACLPRLAAPSWCLLSGPLSPLSSTDLRARRRRVDQSLHPSA